MTVLKLLCVRGVLGGDSDRDSTISLECPVNVELLLITNCFSRCNINFLFTNVNPSSRHLNWSPGERRVESDSDEHLHHSTSSFIRRFGNIGMCAVLSLDCKNNFTRKFLLGSVGSLT